MDFDTRQTDRIVREVIRRLAATSDASRGDALPWPLDSQAPSPTLAVQDRVVSMRCVDGRLRGVKRLRVLVDAVITPSVKDLLRERNIGVERTDRTEEMPEDADPCNVRLILVASPDLTRKTAALLQSRHVECLTCERIDDDAMRRALEANDPGTRGLVLTTDWAAVSCQANRQPHVRAAAVNDPMTTVQACRQIDINVLIVDPTSLSASAMGSIVDEYVHWIRQAIHHPPSKE